MAGQDRVRLCDSGMSIGLLCSGVYYAYMGRRLSKKEGRADVTALPSGVSTPAMFVILYGVIMPLHYALEDPMLAWSAAVAACFIGGAVEFIGGFIGPWMKEKLQGAALRYSCRNWFYLDGNTGCV